MKINFFKKNKIYCAFFILFLLIYLLNFEAYTLKRGTDFEVRYQYYGVKIIIDVLNLDFSSNFFLFGQPNHYLFFNSYFIPELIAVFLSITLSPINIDFLISISKSFFDLSIIPVSGFLIFFPFLYFRNFEFLK